MTATLQPPMWCPGVHLSHPLAQGLVAYWPMWEGSGDTVHDLSGNGNHGALTNGPTWVATEMGGALEFDGDDDFIELGSIGPDHPLSFTGNEFSLAFWLYQESGGDQFQRIIDKSDGGGGANGFAFVTQYTGNEGHVQFYVDGNAIGLYFSGVYSYQTWVHLTLTWDGSAFKLYTDGTYFATRDEADTIPSTTKNCRIGSWNHSTGREFEGKLSNFLAWDRALTAGEIAQFYADPWILSRPPRLM